MITSDRQYRAFDFKIAEESAMIVEGYAAVFDQETVILEINDSKYIESISPDAFEGVSLEDVVMNYNHDGKPVARTKNGTLQLAVDKTGLKVRAMLSGTAEGRQLFEEIKGGYIDKMSFAFTVESEEYTFRYTEEGEEEIRRILKLKRVYDVAAVDIPAYEQTSISARSGFEAEAESAEWRL